MINRVFPIVWLMLCAIGACSVDEVPQSGATAQGQSEPAASAFMKDDLPASSLAQSPFKTVPISNFTLLDHTGRAHELNYYDDARLIVFMTHSLACTNLKNLVPEYEALAEAFRLRNMRFFYINSNVADDREALVNSTEAWGTGLPILDDVHQIVGRLLNLSKVGEVLIVDPRQSEIVYRGPLEHFAEPAIQAFLAQSDVMAPEQWPVDCELEYPPLPEVSYQRDIAPIFIEHCIRCHQPGGIAPWSMTSHAMVQGFAPMISEVITTQRMPPFDADPAVGHWQENSLLSGEKIMQLFSWIDAGAPIGEGEDPLADYVAVNQDWPLGEPDLIVDIPAFEIPASGIIDYRYAQVANMHHEDVWLAAAAIKPGDAKALHHLNAGISYSDVDASVAITDNYLLGWTPGTNVWRMPDQAGVFLPRGSNFLFEMHYTSYGKASVDRSQLGLYFAKEKPEKIMRFGEVVNLQLSIPPYRRSHIDRAYNIFDYDATVYIFGPHAHYRGKRFVFEFRYPDGTEELALNVPKFDFNWQRNYSYIQPKKVPAGTMLIVTTEFDNSAFNDANPNPAAKVTWGPQSADEMLLGSYIFSWDNETSDYPIHDSRKWMLNRRLGYLDRNLDRRVERDELPPSKHKQFDEFVKQVDRDGDGAVTYQEWVARPEVEFR